MKRVALLVMLLTAMPVVAQSAVRKHNNDAPITVDANSLDVADANGRAVWTGDVRITQGDMKLTADTVTALYSHGKNGGDQQIDRIDAQNNVKLVTPSETASGRIGIYDVHRRTITLVGGVTLTHGDSVLRGQRLAIDLDSGRSRLDGASTSTAAGTPGTPTSNGRVSGRFVVPPRTAAN